MKYYTRTTHDFDNKTREWVFRKELINVGDGGYKEKSCLGVHALDNGRWRNLDEIIEENRKYYQQYKDDLYSGASKSGYSKESVLADLEWMEKLGFVTSRERLNWK